jgi:hypothetical protein
MDIISDGGLSLIGKNRQLLSSYHPEYAKPLIWKWEQLKTKYDQIETLI